MRKQSKASKHTNEKKGGRWERVTEEGRWRSYEAVGETKGKYRLVLIEGERWRRF